MPQIGRIKNTVPNGTQQEKYGKHNAKVAKRSFVDFHINLADFYGKCPEFSGDPPEIAR